MKNEFAELPPDEIGTIDDGKSYHIVAATVGDTIDSIGDAMAGADVVFLS